MDRCIPNVHMPAPSGRPPRLWSAFSLGQYRAKRQKKQPVSIYIGAHRPIFFELTVRKTSQTFFFFPCVLAPILFSHQKLSFAACALSVCLCERDLSAPQMARRLEDIVVKVITQNRKNAAKMIKGSTSWVVLHVLQDSSNSHVVFFPTFTVAASADSLFATP